MPYTITGPAMVNILAPTPRMNPSAAVNIGHSTFKKIALITAVWYNEIKRGEICENVESIKNCNNMELYFLLFVYNIHYLSCRQSLLHHKFIIPYRRFVRIWMDGKSNSANFMYSML